MRTTTYFTLNRISIIAIFLFIFSANYAQQTEESPIPAIDLVPTGLVKGSFQLYTNKSEMLKAESKKLMDEKLLLDQKCKDLSSDSPDGKKCETDFAAFNTKVNALITKINGFNTEIEEVVYKDPSIDKLSMITYYTLNKDQKSWDEFQKNILDEKLKLNLEKVKIQKELTKTKTNSKKQKDKTFFNEGVVLSMYAEQDANFSLEDSLKSPFTGVSYKEMLENRQKNMTDSGVVIVSFVMPKKVNDPMEVASRKDGRVPPENFSLASPKAKEELNKLKDKQFNRLIAHSNGATVIECLLIDSLIEVKELNIIGGEKSLVNGRSLQHLLDNGTLKHVIIWVKLDDPAIWITPLDDDKISERTQNFISYKTKFEKKGIKMDSSKIEYRWILGNGSLALLNAKDPQFISAYFKEISKNLRAK